MLKCEKKSLEYRSALSKGRSGENAECDERESHEKCASFKINRFLHSVAGGLLRGKFTEKAQVGGSTCLS